MDRGHYLGAFANRAADPFDRARPHVADREHARHGRFKRRRGRGPIARSNPGDHEARFIERHAAWQPLSRGIGADEQKNVADRSFGLFTGATISPPHALEIGAGRAAERNELSLSHELDVRGRGNAIDQVARHAFGEARPSDHHAHLGRVRGQKHRALTGRIAAANQSDLFARAQPGLDLRGPVPDSAPLKPGYVGDRRMAISSAAGDHDGPRLNALAVLRLQDEGSLVARAVEGLDGDRYHDVRAEFLRLNEGAGRKRLAAYSGRKAKVVFNPGAGAGLTAESASVENRDRQALRAAIDRG